MRKLSVLAAILLISCAQPPAGDARENSFYVSGTATRGGTGIYYMGREIAYVMSHMGADWLDRPDRQQTERTDLLIDNLPFDSSSDVADIGVGSGYFALRIAERLTTGTVYAVDIQPEMLAIVEERAAAANLENIELILATEQSPGLAPESIDLAFMVDAYHEFARPREVMQQLRVALRPGGKIVLIEYRAEDPTVPIIEVHKMSAEQVKKEMTALDFEFVGNPDFLPQQHFLVFSKPVR
ncbi:MAG: class I SAM-dependent methyltransferase [Gammaproteobacteria bacterium]|jgi:ubiquinone/menaquinone biosynthesis C-methylase UbiE|nr:class I SAM-dependent methyltransferase [Gammaproteobacteria bacterium]